MPSLLDMSPQEMPNRPATQNMVRGLMEGGGVDRIFQQSIEEARRLFGDDVEGFEQYVQMLLKAKQEGLESGQQFAYPNVMKPGQ